MTTPSTTFQQRGSAVDLQPLIALSREYGKDPEYIIAGGGNTSFKTKEIMYIKASGVELAYVDESGFVALSRPKIEAMLAQAYSSEPQQREAEVKARLMETRVDILHGKRPSVEAPFHHLLNYAYVVHTHPYLVNAMLSSQEARSTWQTLFGDDTLYIPYVDPGYTLAKRIQADLDAFRTTKGKEPHYIFLENHGVIVGADTCEEIRQLYRDLMHKIQSRIPKRLSIETRPIPSIYQELHPLIRAAFGSGESFVGIRNNSLISKFYENESNFKLVERPFNPDTVVYCKAAPLYIPQCKPLTVFMKTLFQKVEEYKKQWGYPPRIVLVKDVGLIAVDRVERSVQTALEMFEDSLKVAYYTQFFGGPKPMNVRDIQFIDGWEVEAYRRQIAQQKRV